MLMHDYDDDDDDESDGWMEGWFCFVLLLAWYFWPLLHLRAVAYCIGWVHYKAGVRDT